MVTSKDRPPHLAPFHEERIYYGVTKEYEAYQSRKKKRKVHDPPCRNESIARVSQWIDDFISESDNFDRLVQRHIYLIDEIDHLQKQQAQSLSCGDVTVCSEDFDHDDEEVKSLHQDLESTIQDIQLQKQDLGHLVDRLNGVPEAWDYWGYWFSDEPEDRIWTVRCVMGGGCCGRQCSCCPKPRRTATGKLFPTGL